MDKRITNLKEEIIKENISLIKSQYPDGTVDINVEEKITTELFPKDCYLEKMVADDKTIWLFYYNNDLGRLDYEDARMLSLESIDFNITSVLKKIIKF